MQLASLPVGWVFLILSTRTPKLTWVGHLSEERFGNVWTRALTGTITSGSYKIEIVWVVEVKLLTFRRHFSRLNLQEASK